MLNGFGNLTPEVKQGKEKYYDNRMWSMNGAELDTEVEDIGNKLRFNNKSWIYLFAIYIYMKAYDGKAAVLNADILFRKHEGFFLT